LNVITIWDKAIGISFDGLGVSPKLSLSGIISLLIEQIQKEHTRGKARALFDLWTDTVNLKNYGNLIEKTFHTEIDPFEADQVKLYSAAIRSILRMKDNRYGVPTTQ